jgi:SET domain-containing protein
MRRGAASAAGEHRLSIDRRRKKISRSFRLRDFSSRDNRLSARDASAEGRCALAYGQDERDLDKARRLTRFNLQVKRASAGLGLFAAEPIPKGARVIEYAGNLLTEEEYQKCRSSYLFDIGPKGALDGSPRWNRARYINHSCKPNCIAKVRGKRVFIHALRNIKAGEELGYDYGADYFDAYIADACRCIGCTAPRKPKKPKKKSAGRGRASLKRS